MKQAVKALLLDLDGTLIDTAPDMVAALNRQLQSHHRELVTYETARAFVSHGAAALIKLGFGISAEESGYQDLREEYLAEYEKNIAEHSQLFNGMQEVLEHCEQNNLFWGIVTNKPEGLTAALLKGLNLDQRSAVTIGGDSLPQSKPHPMPMLHACMLLKIAPSECLYVGDAARDIESGKRAGTRTATAEWGYIAPKDDPSQWGATYRVTSPIGILDLI
ncbi:MAG TPA: phosphoglycolate phosphatase [Gammaproteobacteria bacterium]|jgi:N-acetyl-D-muramate 6-phosphate phosphatase|nr:phosphoglycolate phosphatase [Gammaproteobacteria bacterium]